MSTAPTPSATRNDSASAAPPRWAFAQLDEIEAQRCPCGWTRRAFAGADNPVATIHHVEIVADAQTHYHNRLTEIYLILKAEGECWMELDGERVPVRPLSTVLIKPGCRHRAVGKMTVINIPVPAFDPADEHFD